MDVNLIKLHEAIQILKVTKRFGLNSIPSIYRDEVNKRLRGNNIILPNEPILLYGEKYKTVLRVLEKMYEYEDMKKSENKPTVEYINNKIKAYIKKFLLVDVNSLLDKEFVKSFDGEAYIVKDLFKLDFSEYPIYGLTPIPNIDKVSETNLYDLLVNSVDKLTTLVLEEYDEVKIYNIDEILSVYDFVYENFINKE